MLTALGLVIGFIICLLFVLVFSPKVNHYKYDNGGTPVEMDANGNALPVFMIDGPKGFVIQPTTEADEAREQVLERNRKLGIDTPLEDLS